MSDFFPPRVPRLASNEEFKVKIDSLWQVLAAIRFMLGDKWHNQRECSILRKACTTIVNHPLLVGAPRYRLLTDIGTKEKGNHRLHHLFC